MSRFASALALALLCLQLAIGTWAQETAIPNSCYCASCNAAALNTPTAEGQFTCAERIDFLIKESLLSEYDACSQVAGVEFPSECGACNPKTCPRGGVGLKKCTTRVIQNCGCNRFLNGKKNCFRKQATKVCKVPVKTQKRKAFFDSLLTSVKDRCLGQMK